MRLSAALIHRDDPHLPEAVASIRPWVDEVVIVDTGSEDGGELAKSLADRFEAYAGCNFPEGHIADFAAARQRSFDLATGEWIVWLDSDDTIRDGHLIRSAIERAEGKERPRIVCKYEYHYTPDGRCATVQWRERIVKNDGSFRWDKPVHENLVSTGGPHTSVYDHGPIWCHHRQGPPADRERNLRILRQYEKTAAPDDAWLEYTLGCELVHHREFAEAKERLTRYMSLSGWEDQKAAAALKLVDICIALDPLGELTEADSWAAYALGLRPEWSEAHFALAKLAMLRGGTRADGHKHMPDVIRHARAAVGRTTDTPLAVHVADAEVHAYEFLQAAHETLEEWSESLGCTERLLQQRPDDPALLLSRRRARYKLGTESHAGLDVVFACPSFTTDRWDPASIARSGAGGSEIAVAELSKRLVKLGHRVRVYGNPETEGLYDGVEYYAMRIHPGAECDVLVAWRDARMLDWWPAKARVLWVHDTQAHGMTERLSLKADAVVALSEWHKENLQRVHNLHTRHVWLHRNGIDPKRFDTARDLPHFPHKAVYSSSPDRGLACLLDMWPAIRTRVPDATLEVLYGFDLWERLSSDEQHKYLIDSLKRRMKEVPGVTFHGKVNPKTLADVMLTAGVWLYPGWFSETSCISAMEAQAAGLYPVASKRAALSETVRHGTLVEGNWLDDDYRARFVDAAVEAMESEQPGRKRWADGARIEFSWDQVAPSWSYMLHSLMEGAEYGALPPYNPVAA